jgi:hypothetical protein
MSTRGLYGLRFNEQDKTAYNHSDSYPEYLGDKFVKWLANKTTEELKKIFNNLELVPDENLTEIDKRWCEKHGIVPKETWYETLSEYQCNPEALEKNDLLVDGSSFILDSLFCEYAYIANLDTNELEFWIGLQKKPDPDNRYGTKSDGKYYPCKLVRTWSFDDDAWENPSDIVNEMIAINNEG